MQKAENALSSGVATDQRKEGDHTGLVSMAQMFDDFVTQWLVPIMPKKGKKRKEKDGKKDKKK